MIVDIPDMPPNPAPFRLGRFTGDVRVQPWRNPPDATPRVRVQGEDVSFDITTADSPPELPEGDVTLFVAGTLDLALYIVEGDCSAHDLAGAFSAESVHGDAHLAGIQGPVVIGTVQGDTVAARLGDDLTLMHVHGDLSVDDVKGTVRAETIHGDATLRRATHAEIGTIHGDLRVQEMTDLAISDAVQGDATLAQITRAILGRVKGDLTALEVSESLQVVAVEGDARLRQMGGTARLPRVRGDVAAQDIAANLYITAEGSAFLESALAAGMVYQLTAEDIVLRARSPISAQFVARSEGGEIRTNLPLTVERTRRNLAGVLGQGEAIVTLQSLDGDIILDAAGEGSSRRGEPGGFRVHIDHGSHGPEVKVEGDLFEGLSSIFEGWPFSGGFGMTTEEPRDYSDVEQRLKDLGERTGRAARKAAERAREYADRAARRARETDWDAVSRDVRTAIERAVGELESTFREIVAEFDHPATTGEGDAKVKSGPTATRITIERDPPEGPVDTTAQTIPLEQDQAPADAEDRAAKRRDILSQVRDGKLTLEEAEDQLKGL
jgi:hypothetical protein